METAVTENQFQLAFIDLAFQLMDTVVAVLSFLTQNVMTIFFSGFIPAA